MGSLIGRGRTLSACLLSMLCLTACATGQGSFVAGSGGSSDSGQAFAEDDGARDDGAAFERDAPGLLAASGNALLPGGRNLAPPTLSGGTSSVSRPLLSTGPVSADVNATASLLNGAAASAGLNTGLASVNVSTALGGPLLALNGSRAALLGVSAVGPNVLGVTPNLSVSLGGAVNPATAATQSLINASIGATAPSGTVTVPTGGGPLLPPVIGVPGTTPLQNLLSLLPTAPKPPVLPGVLGR